MAIFVTTGGYFGTFAVRPRRIKGYGPDGQALYSTPIRMNVIRLGIDAGSRESVGYFDTEKIPYTTEQACKEVYGAEKWQEELVKEIKALHLPLREVKNEDDMPKLQEGGMGPRIIQTMRTVKSAKIPTAPRPAFKDETPGPKTVKKVST